jgi:S1-C subfamily serine protease
MNYIAEIESYLRNEMNTQEIEAFELLVAKNPDLAKELTEYKEIFAQFQHARNEAFVKKQIEIIKDQEDRNAMNISGGMRKSLKKYWRTAGIAATVAILASVGTYFVAENSFNQKDDKRILQLVNKEVRDLKTKQVRLQNDINKVKINALPTYPHNGSGTAFAISNNGYAITNLHVIKDGKKVFLFTSDGTAYKCGVIYQDKTNDLAVLQVLDSNLIFSQNNVPYKLDTKTKLAERIFTLGYPKQEVVYNEGYVSALNGKNGDSTKIQLELPSSPGVSGAPVLDEAGNLIGIINSKQSISKGITYAIKSEVLEPILDSLDDKLAKQSLQRNSFHSRNRTEQIDALGDFIFTVKVYK